MFYSHPWDESERDFLHAGKVRNSGLCARVCICVYIFMIDEYERKGGVWSINCLEKFIYFWRKIHISLSPFLLSLSSLHLLNFFPFHHRNPSPPKTSPSPPKLSSANSFPTSTTLPSFALPLLLPPPHLLLPLDQRYLPWDIKSRLGRERGRSDRSAFVCVL